MKYKKLFGFKLNELVYIIKHNRYDKIVYIDEHAHGNFCMANGGRYWHYELHKVEK